jgi:hypothetical protein
VINSILTTGAWIAGLSTGVVWAGREGTELRRVESSLGHRALERVIAMVTEHGRKLPVAAFGVPGMATPDAASGPSRRAPATMAPDARQVVHEATRLPLRFERMGLDADPPSAAILAGEARFAGWTAQARDSHARVKLWGFTFARRADGGRSG